MSYCFSCKTSHPPGTICPPREVRTTGVMGLRESLALAEEEIKALLEANEKMAASETDLQFAIMQYLNDGKPTAPRSFYEVLRESGEELIRLRSECAEHRKAWKKSFDGDEKLVNECARLIQENDLLKAELTACVYMLIEHLFYSSHGDSDLIMRTHVAIDRAKALAGGEGE